MKLVIADIAHLDVEEGCARLRGKNGHVEVSVHGPDLFSIFYRFEAPPEATEIAGLAEMMVVAESSEHREPWERISDAGATFELSYGRYLLTVEKATGTVAVYRDGLLIHGGPIGTRETVVPHFPVRAESGEGRGRSGRARLLIALSQGDRFYGLGEKSGRFDRRNRRYKMFNRDALGYSAGFSDPLYKSIPFLIKHNPTTESFCGLFFPSLDIEEIDLGVESLYYCAVSFGAGPYGYYVMGGQLSGDSRDLYEAYRASGASATLHLRVLRLVDELCRR